MDVRFVIQVLSIPIHRLDHVLVTVAVGTGKPVVLSEVVGSGKTATLRHVKEQLGKEKGCLVATLHFGGKRVGGAWASSSWRAIF